MGRVNLSRFPPVASLIDSPTKCIPSSVKSCTSTIDTSSRYKLAGEPSLAPVGWRIDCIGRCVVVLTKIHDAHGNVRSNAFPFWRDLLPKSGNDALARWRFPVRQLPNWISATDGKWFDHDLSNFNRSAAENCTRNHRGPSMHGKRWINYRFNFLKKWRQSSARLVSSRKLGRICQLNHWQLPLPRGRYFAVINYFREWNGRLEYEITHFSPNK